MKKTWVRNLVAYGLAMLFTLIGIWFLIISRNSLIAFLNLYYVQGKVLGQFQRGMEVQFFDKVYLLGVAFAILILMIVVEEYLKHGAERGDLVKRICKVFGIEILFMFAAHLASAFLVGFSSLIWLLLIGELIVSIGMIYLSIKLPAATKQPKSLS